ncbi:uncharacterized protein LOC117565266 isoform X3 [Drosophila albomicans]|uniref:Uncharacterized protein LOC117565266 isoform X3 n=1 Tax=Drosophila albomicans TaxID=7291 RepID=A0A9C6WG16_DROAB|nr:uncharacterized protein LOC117565266 isoform X3 [Drosophila albomicans]
MMMSSMLYLSSFLLLSMWSIVLATTDNQLTHPALNKTDATLRRPSNQLTVDQQEDDDYYSDNEPSDSIDSDYAAPKYSNPIWITPTPSPPTSPPSTTPTTPMRTSSSTAMPMAMASSLKRVPRHPQYLWHANRVDDDAAFDEPCSKAWRVGGSNCYDCVQSEHAQRARSPRSINSLALRMRMQILWSTRLQIYGLNMSSSLT